MAAWWHTPQIATAADILTFGWNRLEEEVGSKLPTTWTRKCGLCSRQTRRCSPSTRGNDLYVIPSLGGSARFLAANGRFPAFSPDGTNVSFASNDGRLMVADLGGSEPRALQSGF